MLPHVSGFHYVLVASGNASSYKWAAPMPNQDTRSITQRLDDIIFSQHGACKKINFDGISQLMGTAIQWMLKVMDTKGVRVLVSRKKTSNRAERDISRIQNGL